MKTVTAEQMAEMDRRAQEEYGVPQADLMEKAGKAVADEILKETPEIKKGTIAVICGKGNNGGDGFVAARYLEKLYPGSVSIYAVSPSPKDMREGPARDNMKKAAVLTGIYPVVEILRSSSVSNVYVDALFGTGFAGEVGGGIAGVIDKINSSGSRIYAVDIPSGLNATNGKASKHCVKAFKTITFGLPKTGFYSGDGPDKCGEIVLADIGFPKTLLKEYA